MQNLGVETNMCGNYDELYISAYRVKCRAGSFSTKST